MVKAATCLALIPLLALAWPSAHAAADVTHAPPPQRPAATRAGAHYAWAEVLRVDPLYELVPANAACRQARIAAATAGGATQPEAANTGPPTGSARAPVPPTNGSPAGQAGGVVAAGEGVDPSAAAQPCVAGAQVDQHRQIRAFDVEYRYRGDIYRSQLSYDPGERLRVRVSVTPAD